MNWVVCNSLHIPKFPGQAPEQAAAMSLLSLLASEVVNLGDVFKGLCEPHRRTVDEIALLAVQFLE